MCPCWVPGPIVRCCGPSRVSTSVSVPSAAWAMLMVKRGVEVVGLALEARVGLTARWTNSDPLGPPR